MFLIPKLLCVTIGCKVINPHILRKYFGRHLGLLNFNQIFFLTFSMSFCIIFFIYSGKNQLVTNLFNDQRVMCIILSRVHVRVWFML